MKAKEDGLFLLLLFTCIALVSCKSTQQIANHNSSSNIFLANVMNKSNQALSASGLQLVSYSKQATIHSTTDINSVIAKLTDEETAYIPLYNPDLSKVDVLTAKQIKERPESAKSEAYTTTLREDWKQSITELLKNSLTTGNEVYKLNWEQHGKSFTTLCILNSDGLVYDPVLTNIVKVTVENISHVETDSTISNN